MYESKEAFYNDFLLPVIRKTWLHMAMNGVYALNIPIYMYDEIKPLLGEADEHVPLTLSKGSGTYKEYIYVWHKKARSLPPSTFKDDRLVVKPSSKGGNGLFSTMPLTKGTVLHAYEGVPMTLREFKETYGNDTRYTMSQRRKNQIIVGKGMPYLTSNVGHYANEVNKGEEPNIAYKGGKLITIRPIETGEELLLQYPNYYPRTW
jgi:hypothetical protein